VRKPNIGQGTRACNGASEVEKSDQRQSQNRTPLELMRRRSRCRIMRYDDLHLWFCRPRCAALRWQLRLVDAGKGVPCGMEPTGWPVVSVERRPGAHGPRTACRVGRAWPSVPLTMLARIAG